MCALRSHFSIGGKVGFVALVGIPLNGLMLLRILRSDFSICCLDLPKRCAATNSCHYVPVVPEVVPAA